VGKHNKHEIVYSIGDHVTVVRGPWSGRRGVVIQRLGFFKKKYKLVYTNGSESPALPAEYLDFYN
jgi:hypothetical protein